MSAFIITCRRLAMSACGPDFHELEAIEPVEAASAPPHKKPVFRFAVSLETYQRYGIGDWLSLPDDETKWSAVGFERLP